MKNYKKIIFIISLGVWFLWISLFSSYEKISGAKNIYEPEATGGFPLTAFWYPHSPMGSNYPPSESWFPFLLNFLFWLIVAFAVYFIFKDKIKNKRFGWFIFSAISISIVGTAYLVLMYD